MTHLFQRALDMLRVSHLHFIKSLWCWVCSAPGTRSSIIQRQCNAFLQPCLAHALFWCGSDGTGLHLHPPHRKPGAPWADATGQWHSNEWCLKHTTFYFCLPVLPARCNSVPLFSPAFSIRNIHHAAESRICGREKTSPSLCHYSFCGLEENILA